MKICRSCNISKSEDEYYRNALKCKACVKKANKEYYEKNRERINQRSYQWFENNKSRHNLNAQKWRKKNPVKTKASILKNQYGITMLQFEDLLKQQDHKCGVCKKPQSEMKKAFSVDHCHTTGKVRGLLCNNCNVAIGLLKVDSGIDNLQNAIKYVQRDVK